MQKLAIFGGTFNPVHWGHLLVAETALDQFSLDRVLWVPTYQPAYKPIANLLGFHHRLEMVRRAIDAHSHFSLSTVEQEQLRPSYAIHTLTALQATYPNTYWYWIIGLDAFRTLPHWYRHQELASHCDWLVTPRSVAPELSAKKNQAGQSSLDSHAPFSTPHASRLLCQQVAQTLAAESLQLQWHLLEMPPVGISSSLVRQRCADRQSIRYLVPESVRYYIMQQGLYQRDVSTEEAANDS